MRPERPHERTFFIRSILNLQTQLSDIDDGDFGAAALLLLAAQKSLEMKKGPNG